MKKSELLELLKDLQEDSEINETLQSIEGIKKEYTLEDFKKQLETNPEVKAYYQSSLDSGIGKGVASFKEKTLPKIIEEEIKKANNKNKTPEQLQIEELSKQLEEMKKANLRAEMTNKYTKVLNERGLNTDLLPFILADDEETTENNINTLNDIINSNVSTKVKEKIVDNPPIPENSEGGRELSGVEKAFFERTGIKLL